MTDPPGYGDVGDEAGVGPDRAPMTGTPRWVKVFGVIALLVVVVFVVLLVVNGGPPGGHGPGRHGGVGGGPTTPTGAAAHE